MVFRAPNLFCKLLGAFQTFLVSLFDYYGQVERLIPGWLDNRVNGPFVKHLDRKSTSSNGLLGSFSRFGATVARTFGVQEGTGSI